MTTNEAAEFQRRQNRWNDADLDRARAEERRATVERIRTAFLAKGWTLDGEQGGAEDDATAILDEEAAR